MNVSFTQCALKIMIVDPHDIKKKVASINIFKT